MRNSGKNHCSSSLRREVKAFEVVSRTCSKIVENYKNMEESNKENLAEVTKKRQ